MENNLLHVEVERNQSLGSSDMIMDFPTLEKVNLVSWL